MRANRSALHPLNILHRMLIKPQLLLLRIRPPRAPRNRPGHRDPSKSGRRASWAGGSGGGPSARVAGGSGLRVDGS